MVVQTMRGLGGGDLMMLLLAVAASAGGAEAWCGDHGGTAKSFAITDDRGQHYHTKCHDCGATPWHPATVGDCYSCHDARRGNASGYPYSCTDGGVITCSDTPCNGHPAPAPAPPPPPTPADTVACMCCSGSATGACTPHYIGWAASKEDCASRYPSQCSRCDEKHPRAVGPYEGVSQCQADETGVGFPFFGSCQCTCCTGEDCDPAYQGVASSPEECAKKYPECASCTACDPRYRADCPKDKDGNDIVPKCDFECGESPYRGVAVFFIVLAVLLVCCICIGGVVYATGGGDELRRRVTK